MDEVVQEAAQVVVVPMGEQDGGERVATMREATATAVSTLVAAATERIVVIVVVTVVVTVVVSHLVGRLLVL